jgi:glycosyltransferase involved in cell wall biosynthesis
MTGAHILLFEPDARGHEMDYVRHFADAFRRKLDHPRITLLTTERAADHPNCRNAVGEYADILTLRVAPPVTEGHALFRRMSSYYEYQWKNAESFARGFAGMDADDVDVVLLPNLEAIGLMHLSLRPGLFRGRPWTTISHHIRFHHRSSGIKGPFQSIDLLQRAFFRWIVRDRALICFGTNNPYLAGAVHNQKVAYCPAPAVAPELHGMAEARAAYGLRPETCVILVFGVIDRRKAIDALIEGAARLSPELDLTILLAGAQNAGDMEPILNAEAARTLRERGRLVEVNRFIRGGEEIDPMSAADMVWVFYAKNFFSNSDVLTRASASGRPVIARDQGLIGKLVADHRLGLAVASDAPDDIASALTRLVRDPDLRRTMGENGARAFVQHTPENLTRPIVDAIGRHLATE